MVLRDLISVIRTHGILVKSLVSNIYLLYGASYIYGKFIVLFDAFRGD